MSKLICIDSGANGGICVWDLNDHTYVLEKLTGDTMETLKPVLDRHFAVTAEIETVVIERPPYFMGTMIPSSRIAILFEAFGLIVNLIPIIPKDLHKKEFPESVPADDIDRSFAALFGQLHSFIWSVDHMSLTCETFHHFGNHCR